MQCYVFTQLLNCASLKKNDEVNLFFFRRTSNLQMLSQVPQLFMAPGLTQSDTQKMGQLSKTQQ